MGKENLIQYNGQTPEQARENGRRGGLASGVSRRQRKLLREVINEVLPLTVSDASLRSELESMGLDPSNEVAIALAAVNRAVQGDIEAARFIRDTRGEKPVAGLAVGNIADLASRPIASLDLTKLSDEELEELICAYEEQLPVESGLPK